VRHRSLQPDRQRFRTDRTHQRRGLGQRLRRLAGDQPARWRRRDSDIFGRRGDAERNVSTNLVSAIDLAKKRAAKVFGIVGKDTGYTARHGDVVVVIPQVNPAWVTPLSEAFQAVVWHCLVSHPKLQKNATKW
jgi:hypothetical protein